MNKIIVSAAVVLVAAAAFIFLADIKSLQDLAELCCVYPLQAAAYAYNTAVVVLGYISESFWLLYICALIDLIMTAAAIFTLI